MKRTLVAFKTHKDNEEFRTNLKYIKESLIKIENHDLIILNDSTSNNLYVEDVNILNYNQETLISGKKGYDFWYRADIPMVFLKEQYPNYDFYYQIEYDCESHNWEYFFTEIDKYSYDFISTWVKDVNKEPGWCWWPHLNDSTKRVTCNIETSKDNLLGCYFPIIRFSTKSLNILDEYYKKGSDGFCEVLVPTILNVENCSIKDIGELIDYIYIRHKNENLLRYRMKH